jgi:CelD/BcsL family acetyltransferase involved in cellulose biosynthesis
MQIGELHSGERARAGEAWAALEAQLPAPRLTCSWDWTETWLEHYGDAVAHRFLLGTEGDEPVGIALVTDGVAPAPGGALRPRVLHLGTAGEPPGETVWVERNGLLAAPGAEAAFATALLAALQRRRGWDRLALDGFLPADLAPLERADARVQASVEETPLADLRGGFEEDGVLSALSSSARRRVRQTLRAFGDGLELEWAETTERGLELLAELAELHQQVRTAAGDAGAFASARFSAFHRALIARLGPERVMLVRVRRGEETVGCLYGLVEGERLLFYQSGLRRYEDNRLRAGVAVHALAMRACAERGLAIYDFLAPADRYKRELATGAETLAWARLERRTPRTLLAQARRRALRGRSAQV